MRFKLKRYYIDRHYVIQESTSGTNFETGIWILTVLGPTL